MRSTFDYSNSFLAEHLAIFLVCLLTLFDKHVSLQYLRVHIRHATHPLSAIALPLWLADKFPIAKIFWALLKHLIWRKRYFTPSCGIKPFK